MSSGSIFHESFRAEPFWWERSPRPAELAAQSLPARADVLVIGSGFTGLAAALVLARAGRDTLVVDAEAAGFGCSSRNGGQVGTSIKPGYGELSRLHGETRARAIIGEGHAALEFIEALIREEGIDCDWEVVGRFVGAHNPAAYEALGRKLAGQPKGLEVESHLVPRGDQVSEIGSELYHGGLIYPKHAALDPARFHAGLLDRAVSAGARIRSHCPVLSVERDGGGFLVRTSRGTVSARNVVVATNGYTGRATPSLRRRVIPIGSYIIATEVLPEATALRLIPRARVVSDTRRVVFYYRLSPDRRRLLFGGRVALWENDTDVTAPRLHKEMCKLFPQLAETRISHAWHGTVAYTFDTMPHIGVSDGMHYAMGYCGSGISMSVYLGTRLGQQLLDRPEGRTALDGLPFPTRPLYHGKPWFLAPSIMFYRLRDRLNV